MALFCLIPGLSLLVQPTGFSASGNWTGLTNGDWSNAGNWSATPSPGSTSVTNNTETATFNGAGNANTSITIDANRNLRTINFDTSTVSYTFNGGGLRLTTGAAIALLATATGTNLIQTFNTPITLYGNTTFTNARADIGSALVFTGNITNAALSTLTLAGAGTGTGNLISGNLTDGGGVQSLSIISTAGKWTLSGSNSYSGLTSITGAGSTTVMAGSNSSAGATTLNNATATLQLNSTSNGGLASGLLTLTAGTLEALNATRSLSNAITMSAVTIQGDQSINLDGKLTGFTGGARTLTNNLVSGKTLTLSTVDINTETANARTLTFAGTGNTTVSSTIANGNGTTANGITVTNTGVTTLSGANTYSGTTTMNAAAGTLVLSGSNSSAGATTLTSGTLQLNSASNGGLASGLLTLTAGRVEALNADRSLSNAIALGGNVTIAGDQNLNLNGKVSGGSSSRILTNSMSVGKTLTLSDIDVSSDTANNRSLTIAGSGNTTITGVIANGNGTTANGMTVTNTGITTLTGASSYTGSLSLNGGTTILDATSTAASLNSVSSLAFGGGAFVFKGNNSGTAQTLGAVTLNASSGSSLAVIAGTSGTILNLGAFTNAGLLNITLDSTLGTAAVTTTSTLTSGLFSRSNVTLTIGGVTEFATIDGSNFITQYTDQSAFVTTGASTATNYLLTGSSTITAATSLVMATLKIATSSEDQSLDLNGKVFQLGNSGLLFTGAHNYEIKDTGGTGQFNGGGGGNVALNIHHYGTGTLTISADIVSPSGTATLSINGPGTTVLSGNNVYSGNTYFGGGATVSINASSTLGNSALARSVNLNSATLRATETFSLENGANARLIVLGANGGTIAVDSGKTLTAPGVISGVGSLTKSGAGTFEVSAANTYTGDTTVNAGTLLVSGTGSINTTSAIGVSGASAKLRYDSSVALNRNVTVTGGGTFAHNSVADYTGTFAFTNGKLGGTNWNGTSLGGLTIGANQTLTPGNSPGTATTTAQTWASLGSYDWEINQADGTAGTDPGWDLINLSGTLSITATSGSKFTINLISLGLDNLSGNASGFNAALNYHWLIADAASAISTFSADQFALNTTGFTNAFSGVFGIARGDALGIGGDNTQLYLTYSIPEPSAGLLFLGGLGILAFLRRRSRD